jgi:hypothetical protein
MFVPVRVDETQYGVPFLILRVLTQPHLRLLYPDSTIPSAQGRTERLKTSGPLIMKVEVDGAAFTAKYHV